MSSTNLTLGTAQFVEFELECETKGYVMDPDDWTVESSLLEINDTYVAETATWAATAVVVDGLKYYGQVLLSTLISPVVAGKYHVLCRAAPTGGELEAPLFVVKGIVNITDPLDLGVVEEPT
jgi:hypothetical protein